MTRARAPNSRLPTRRRTHRRRAARGGGQALLLLNESRKAVRGRIWYIQYVNKAYGYI